MKAKFTILIILINVLPIFAQDWTAFVDNAYSYSSPKATDLNGDGVKDIVLGAGIEDDNSENGIVAINGANGEMLWNVPARNQIFATPALTDVTGDGVKDVFVGGRVAEFRAINGATGEQLWEFFPNGDIINPIDSGWYNFYSAQVLPDIDGDGFDDLLVANGGDYTAGTIEDPNLRPVGNLMVLSSANGSIIARDTMPDGQETYMSPLVIDLYNSGNLYVIFGSGGENTFNFGHLYKAPLSDLLNNNLSNAVEVYSSSQKGFIAPPTMVDMNDDSVLDFVISLYNGKVVVVDGFTNETIWEVEIEMGETNASPGIGHFNNDDVPDVFVTYAIGLAPTFTDFRQIMIDGASGEIQYNESVGFFQFNTPVIIDYDNDGKDEAILSMNYVDETGKFTTDLSVFDFNNGNTITTIYGPYNGANINSTPLLTNIDNDGMLDLVYLHSESQFFGGFENGFYLKKYSLNIDDNTNIPFGGYLGTNSNGIYENPLADCANYNPNFEIDVTAANCNDLGAISVQPLIGFCGSNGVDCNYNWFESSISTIATANNLQAGEHFVEITSADGGCSFITQVIVPYQQPNFTFEYSFENCNYQETVGINIEIVNAQAPFIICMDGDCSNPTLVPFYINNNLSCGEHIFSVGEANGCITEEVFTIPCPIQVSTNVIHPSSSNSLDGSIELTINGGSGNYSITLNDTTTIEGTLITEIGEGSFNLLIEDENGCSVIETVELVATSTYLINDNTQVYINNSSLIIDSQRPISNWTIFTIDGKLLLQGNENANKHIINIENLSMGTYIFKYQVGKTCFAQKIIKY